MKFGLHHFSWVITIPLFVAAICFAVGNRLPTIISFWPFGIEMTLPIYLLALAPFAVGLLSGALIQWVNGLKHKVAVMRLRRENTRLKQEMETLRKEMAAAKNQAASAARPEQALQPVRLAATHAKPSQNIAL